MAAVLATRVQRDREREQAQVERARRRVAGLREVEVAVVPTAERVDQEVRGAMAGHLGEVLTVRVGRGARSETVTARITALYRCGALGQTEHGMPLWLPYRDLYCAYAVVLEPAGVRDAVQRAAGRLRRGAPRGDAR